VQHAARDAVTGGLHVSGQWRTRVGRLGTRSPPVARVAVSTPPGDAVEPPAQPVELDLVLGSDPVLYDMENKRRRAPLGKLNDEIPRAIEPAQSAGQAPARGINEGATTTQSCPAAANWRWMP
jgi:hypothetical protein